MKKVTLNAPNLLCLKGNNGNWSRCKIKKSKNVFAKKSYNDDMALLII